MKYSDCAVCSLVLFSGGRGSGRNASCKMLTLMDGMKRNESFVFYLQHNDEASSSSSLADTNAFRPAEGEQEIAGACKMVIYYPPFSDNRTGILGTLYCTTLRIVFVPATDTESEASEFRTSRVFSSFKYETSLLNICQVQYASGADSKKLKPLTSFLQHPDQVVLVKIYCKDFRIFTFDFKSSEGYRALLNAMLRYAFPLKLTNVVSVYRQFSLSNNHHSSVAAKDDVPSFDSKTHWEMELRRTGAASFAWRVTHVNIGRRYVEGYPEYFVVPTLWLDNMISVSCSNWTNRRIPVWCWSSPHGCALIRSSTLNTISEVTEKQWQELENSIASAHPNKVLPVSVDSTVNCHELMGAYEALRKLCSADAGSVFWHTDSRWLSEVESSGWSTLVMKCLQMTDQVVRLISQEKRSVIFREPGNADIACVVSSLVQLCLDPYFRTFGGFTILLQKEWIALAHPFALRLFGLASESRSEDGCTPVFLLFLDCVWQLMLQYPCSFALSSHYLIALWDLSLTGLTRTFLFNNLRESSNFKGNSMRSAWCLDSYFTRPYRHLFMNPLYAFCRGLEPLADEDERAVRYDKDRSISVDDGVQLRHRNHVMWDIGKMEYQRLKNRQVSDDSILIPNSSVAAYRFWDDCYLRWSAPAQTLRGGQTQTDLQLTAIIADISHQLNELRYLRDQSDTERTRFGNQLRHFRVQSMPVISEATLDRATSAFPFGWNTIPIPDYLYILPLQQQQQHQQGVSKPRSDLELATLCLSPHTQAMSCERLSVWGGGGAGVGASGNQRQTITDISRKKNRSVTAATTIAFEAKNKVQARAAQVSTNSPSSYTGGRKFSTDTVV